ncbi:MAG TPA: hypothetical protein VHB48_15490 [Chitinophagaceae bacterium]|nr:hypothetical protein [Chitinophagaceae bacterium]
MNTYLLLRNNKEAGPFDFDSLIKQGLRQYDLIWVEGKSAAWRYPCEINELKPYAPAVEEQPYDRFFKKNKTTGTQAIEPQPQVTIKPKPRIRIKAAWQKVDEITTPAPVVADNTQDYYKPVSQPPKQRDEYVTQNSWLNWQEEVNAVESASKKQEKSVPIGEKQLTGEMPILETRFSQSLNELKDRYAATILKAKNKTGEWQRYKSGAILVLLAIPVMCLGVWLGYKWTAGDNAGKTVYANTTPAANKQAASVSAAEKGNEDVTENNASPQKNTVNKDDQKELVPRFDDDNAETAPVKKKQAVKTVAFNAAKNIQPQKIQPAVVQTVTVVKSDATNRQPVATVNTKQQRNNIIAPVNTGASARRKTVNDELVKDQPAQPAVNSKAAAPAIPKDDDNNATPPRNPSNKPGIDDFVSVDADQPYTPAVQNLKLSVQNIADIALDLVVIDVQYFDAANKFKNGQTIRIKNIPAGEAINVKVPDNLAAASIKYKVSLVSAEQKGVYLVAE